MSDWPNCSVRSAAWTAAARPGTSPRRPAFFKAAVIWAVASFAASAGVGALASNASTMKFSRPALDECQQPAEDLGALMDQCSHHPEAPGTTPHQPFTSPDHQQGHALISGLQGPGRRSAHSPTATATESASDRPDNTH